jgi:TM2 domain-containing membrane protein YozV
MYRQNPPMSSKTRTNYVVLGIFLGGFGVHNFYAGRSGVAVAQLLISLIGFLIGGPIIVGIWVIVELFTVTRDGQGLPFS